MNYTKKGFLVMVSQEKWEKTQRLVEEMREMLGAGTKIYRPILESIQGLSIYVARTHR